MKYQIDFDKPTRLLISHLPPTRKARIKEALRSIVQEPWSGKALQDELTGLYCFRVSTLRIIYAINVKKKKIHVLAVGPRKTIYKLAMSSRAPKGRGDLLTSSEQRRSPRRPPGSS
jgi:mRNA-degrading endonuclease RelE of RelBE toxin-antitoxin system